MPAIPVGLGGVSLLEPPFLETTLNRPMDLIVEEIVSLLDDNLREEFEERAAIIEFDAHLLRAHAECLALLYVLRRHPEILAKRG